MKRFLCMLLVLALLPVWAFSDDAGFCSDVDRINDAAKSVLMLEISRRGRLIATGSAFFVLDSQTIVTNYHVIEEGDQVTAYSDDGEVYTADRVLITDEENDLAILSLSAVTAIPPLLFSDHEIRRAAPVVAIGSPKGILNTVSLGNISGFFEEDGIRYVQFTAPISSGSSGGVLLDDWGEVIGITSAAYDDGEGIIQNLNFAISVEDIRDLCSRMSSYVSVTVSEFGKGMLPYDSSTAQPTPKPTTAPNRIDDKPPSQNVTPAPSETIAPDISLPQTWITGIPSPSQIDAFFTFRTDGTVLLESADEAEPVFYRVDANTITVYDKVSDDTLTFTPVVGGALQFSVNGETVQLHRVAQAYTSDLSANFGKEGSLAGIWEYDGAYLAIELAMENGTRGDCVMIMQEALLSRGYLNGSADGIFGRQTAQAVVLCKEALGIPTDAYQNIATARMLHLLYASRTEAVLADAYALVIPDESWGEWEFSANGTLSMHIQVSNAGSVAVQAFDLEVYATDKRDQRGFRAGATQTFTNTLSVEPGQTVFSDDFTIPGGMSIGHVYAGISRVVYADGTVFVPNEVSYFVWDIE